MERGRCGYVWHRCLDHPHSYVFMLKAFGTCDRLHKAWNTEILFYLLYSHSAASLSDFFVDAWSGPNTLRRMAAASWNWCLSSSFRLFCLKATRCFLYCSPHPRGPLCHIDSFLTFGTANILIALRQCTQQKILCIASLVQQRLKPSGLPH